MCATYLYQIYHRKDEGGIFGNHRDQSPESTAGTAEIGFRQRHRLDGLPFFDHVECSLLLLFFLLLPTAVTVASVPCLHVVPCGVGHVPSRGSIQHEQGGYAGDVTGPGERILDLRRTRWRQAQPRHLLEIISKFRDGMVRTYVHDLDPIFRKGVEFLQTRREGLTRRAPRFVTYLDKQGKVRSGEAGRQAKCQLIGNECEILRVR